MNTRYFKHPEPIFRLAILLYVRYPLSLRQVEDLLFARGIDVSYETVRRWWNRFGPQMAHEISHRRRRSGEISKWRWHLDEVFVRVGGRQVYLWRAVDHEGEVLDAVVSKRRDRAAALKLLRSLMRRHGVPAEILTDRLASYRAALSEIGVSREKHTAAPRANNRAENSHQPFRRAERACLGFRSLASLQKFAVIQGQIGNHFGRDRHLILRSDYKLARGRKFTEWQEICA